MAFFLIRWVPSVSRYFHQKYYWCSKILVQFFVQFSKEVFESCFFNYIHNESLHSRFKTSMFMFRFEKILSKSHQRLHQLLKESGKVFFHTILKCKSRNHDWIDRFNWYIFRLWIWVKNIEISFLIKMKHSPYRKALRDSVEFELHQKFLKLIFVKFSQEFP